MMQFTLYSRSYCHLCDDMLEQLRACLASDPEMRLMGLTATIKVIEVDADASLVALYDELVPVLTGQKNQEQATQICHYFLDIAKLKAFLHA